MLLRNETELFDAAFLKFVRNILPPCHSIERVADLHCCIIDPSGELFYLRDRTFTRYDFH